MAALPLPDPDPRRLGVGLPPQPRSLWIVGGEAAAVASAYAVVDAALAARPGYRVILAAPRAARAALFRRWPHEILLPPPAAAGLGRWIRALAPALVVIAPGAPAGLAERLAAAGVATLPAAAATAEAILARLPMVAHGAVDPASLPAATPAATGGLGPLGRLVDPTGRRRIPGLGELARRLGRPRAIVCLGNGPSSEDPRLAARAGDTVFRVNWIWRGRGLFARPDMVFTVDPDLPRGRPRPVLAFPTAAVARPILGRHALLAHPPTAGFTLLEDWLPAARPQPGTAYPTNGALMVAVAAALAPDRLTIAGIDLYRHPAGRYPGDAEAADGYGRQHSLDSDLAVIRAALAGYRGEVTILGEALAASLAAGDGQSGCEA